MLLCYENLGSRLLGRKIWSGLASLVLKEEIAEIHNYGTDKQTSEIRKKVKIAQMAAWNRPGGQ